MEYYVRYLTWNLKIKSHKYEKTTINFMCLIVH